MMKKSHLFLKRYIGTILFLFLLTCIINWIVDPYEIFLHQIVPLEMKPGAYTHMRMHKAHYVTKLQPQTIILGTSRAGTGIDPLHAGFKNHPVYNLAIDGANIYELYRYFEHANHQGTLKEVILALDFLSFNALAENKPDFDEHRLYSETTSFTFEKELFSSLFTFEALKDSFKTIFHLFESYDPILNQEGQTGESALMAYRTANGGALNTSLYSENGYITSVYNQFNLISSRQGSYFQFYKNLIEKCHQQNIALTILVLPIHARHHLVIDSIGLWPTYLNWKRELVRINEALAKLSGQRAYALWDFSEFNAFNTENIDAHTSEMQWYWETTHFNRKLGTELLNKALQDSSPNHKLGVRLTSANIEQFLQKLDTQKEQYKGRHFDLYAQMKSKCEMQSKSA